MSVEEHRKDRFESGQNTQKRATTTPCSLFSASPAATMLSPHEVVEAISARGLAKVGHSALHVSIQGALAGIYIAVGALLAIVVAGGTSLQASPGLTKLLMGATFPVGLVMVVLLGGELFTGETMYVTMAWLKQPDKVGGRALLRHWAAVYAANFAGSLLVVVFAVGGGLVAYDPWHTFARSIAETKTSLGWGSVLLRGIGANFLVNVALFQAAAAQDAAGKILAIWFPIMAFVTMSLDHCVANMFFIPLGLMCGANTSVGAFLWQNLVPSTLGNIIGGAVLVAAAQWATYGRAEHDRGALWLRALAQRWRRHAHHRNGVEEAGSDTDMQTLVAHSESNDSSLRHEENTNSTSKLLDREQEERPDSASVDMDNEHA